MKIIIDTDDLSAITRLIAAGFNDFHVQGAWTATEPNPAPTTGETTPKPKFRFGTTGPEHVRLFLDRHGPATYSEIRQALVQGGFKASTTGAILGKLVKREQVARLEGRKWANNTMGSAI